uniref:Uncharacterized protein n=1 Tax=Sphaerodactylus townsendi TaxID=933632 RepID=A0ACB8EA20_9SAUR
MDVCPKTLSLHLVVVSAPVVAANCQCKALQRSANRGRKKVAVPVARSAVPSVPRAASAKGSLPQNAAAASEFCLTVPAMTTCIFDCLPECNLIVRFYMCLCIF